MHSSTNEVTCVYGALNLLQLFLLLILFLNNFIIDWMHRRTEKNMKTHEFEEIRISDILNEIKKLSSSIQNSCFRVFH